MPPLCALIRARAPIARFSPVLHQNTPLRAFTISSSLRLKEDADRSPEHLEQKKQEQLDKQKRGEGHWHEELASHGESNVKADREEVDDHDKHMEDLQKEGAGKAEEGKI